MSIKCVAFDADETLYSLDTSDAYNKKFEFLSSRTGMSSEKIRRKWLRIVEELRTTNEAEKRSREYSTRKTLEELGFTGEKDNIVRQALNVFWDNVKVKTNPLAGETMEKLHEDKALVVAVASDEYRKHLRMKLIRAGLPNPDCTISPENTGELKPSTKFYEELIKKTGFKPHEIIMVGDSWERDLKPAKLLGIHTVLYRKHEGNPDFFIDSLNDIIDIIEGKVVIPDFFKRYDVRGKNPPLDGKAARLIGEVIGSFSPGDVKLVVGKDNKASSKEFEEKLIAGSTYAGAEITRVGVGPSDYISFCTRELNADYGVMVTASHLPPEYNGFKFFYSEGNGFMNEDLARVKRRFMHRDTRYGHGMKSDNDLRETYLKHAEKVFRKRFEEIDARILVDSGGGTAENFAPSLLERLGAEVIEIKENRPSDCSKKENLSYLPKRIMREDADGAVAFDLDADRIAFFDANGKWVDGDELFCIAAKELAGKDDVIVASMDTSSMLEESVDSKIVYTRIGDPFVISEVIKQNAVLGGEPNGHYCLPEFVPYNSGVFFSTVFAKFAREIPSMRMELPLVFMDREEVQVENPSLRVHNLKSKISKEYELISLIDGIKFRTNDSTVLIRPSGTSNVVRINVESKDKHIAKLEAAKFADEFF